MGYKKKYEKQYQYILECMNPDGFDDATPEAKLQNFVETFAGEYCSEWNKKQMPILKNRIACYLQGLPSACSVDYETYSVFLLGQEWGYVSQEIKTEHLPTILADTGASKFINNWYRLLADRIYELLDYYDIQFPVNCF